MTNEEIGRRSRWMIRAMEWDDPRARYPNLWHEGMPRQILAFDRVVSRLRIGDLIAVYYPASQRYPDRAERFLGLSRVVGLRLADAEGFGWIEMATAHRFDPPLRLKSQPRRVFLCCDPGWPGPEVELFQAVFDAAVAAGWQPREDEMAPPAEVSPAEEAKVEEAKVEEAQVEEASAEPVSSKEPVEVEAEATAEPEPAPRAEPPEPVPATPVPEETGEGLRMFAGVDYSGDMRDPRERTWLAITVLRGDRLRVSRLEATGRHGLQGYLRDPDRSLMNVEAIGLDFPFGLPTPFAERILGGEFPEEGWWALVRRMERISRPEYLVAVQEFRDAEGEIKRLTDERAQAFSPLHRVNPDLGPMTYHGIRMIGEDRSRFAIRPFETAQGKLLLEVYPGGVVKDLTLDQKGTGSMARGQAILDALSAADYLPLDVDQSLARACLARRDALDAVIAARCAAVAVLTGEADRTPDELSPGEGERVRREGWIYGLEKRS